MIHLISHRTVFVLSAVLCVSACQAEDDDGLSQSEADEVAAATAALTSNEVAAIQKTFSVTGQYGSANKNLTVVCKDAAGAVQTTCGADTDSAEVDGTLDAVLDVPDKVSGTASGRIHW